VARPGDEVVLDGVTLLVTAVARNVPDSVEINVLEVAR
jgi:hypothetical protein